MATKTRLLLIASLPVTIALTFGVLSILPPRPGVTRTNFDRIENGMTRAEAEEIFGEKATGWGEPRLWIANDVSMASIDITDDCVKGKEWHQFNETILDKIRRWLHLR